MFCKVIRLYLVGDFYVGKTALQHYFSNGEFNPDTHPTVGATYINVQKIIDDTETIIKIYEVFNHHEFILNFDVRYAGGILLVYDVKRRSSFNYVQELLSILKEKIAVKVPIFLVGNKAESPDRKVSKEEGELMADKLGFMYFETSAKTGYNVEQTLVKIATIANFEMSK